MTPTASTYGVNGAPMHCQECGKTFCEVNGHKVRVHTAHGYFCSSDCAKERQQQLALLQAHRTVQ